MKYKIDDEWEIEGDGHSYSLSYLKDEINPKTKNKFTNPTMYYYPSLRLCLEAYADKCTVPCNTPKEILSKLEECLKIVKDFKC
jgi:hypothetical protein